MENENEQIIYINIDDSGKLVSTEKVSTYAGLVFTSKIEKDKFITQYKSIVQDIRCKYCNTNILKCTSNKSCPEIKHNMLNPKHRRQLMNYIKKYSILCCIINNDPNIKDNTASRGRFLDYALKLLIKQTIKGLIKEEKIDPHKPIRLILNIDDLLEFSKRTDFINYKIILP